MSHSNNFCEGCGQKFSASGLTSHLRQTANPICRAVFRTQVEYFFFGEYEAEDFEWDEVDSEPESDIQSDIESEFEMWEPPPSSRPVSPIQADFDVDDNELNPAPSANQRHTMESRFRSPRFVVTFHDKYLGAKAGMPTGHGTNSYLGYDATILRARTPWAPFISKMDWEIARWAKLRGPGSTAFSELLSIDGVGFQLRGRTLADTVQL
jgi:hypothetical protein